MFRIGAPGALRPWLGAAILGLFALALKLPLGRPSALDGSLVAGSGPADDFSGLLYFLLLGLEPLTAWSLVRDGVKGVPLVTLLNFGVLGLGLLALAAVGMVGGAKPPAWLGVSGGLATLTALHPTFLPEVGYVTPWGPGALAWGAGSLLAVAACVLPGRPAINRR
jgi:hypothetical protein